jgi:adenylate kinase
MNTYTVENSFNARSTPAKAAVLISLIAVAFPCTAQLQPPRTIILIGPPGSGKTVQAEYLRKRFKIPTISIAELLQQEIDRRSPSGQLLAKSVSSGELLSDESANELMKARLLRPDAGRGFVLDGYPVTEVQAKALDVWLLEHDLPKPTVIILDVPDELLRNRLRRRRRADDTSENIERRLRDYQEVGRVVEQWYGSRQTARVNGEGTVTEVAKRVADAVESVRPVKELKTRDPDKQELKRRGTEQ